MINPEPEHFVGQLGPISRAETALAAGSGLTAVVLHGAAGVSKSPWALC